MKLNLVEGYTGRNGRMSSTQLMIWSFEKIPLATSFVCTNPAQQHDYYKVGQETGLFLKSLQHVCNDTERHSIHQTAQFFVHSTSQKR